MAARNLAPEDSPLALFGSEVRHYRDAADLTQRDLGEKIGYSEQAVGMIETANRKPTLDFAERCDELFNTGGALVRLWPLVRRAGVRPWFAEFIELEAQATAIHMWEPQWVPGLFQTEEYVRELVTAYKLHAPEEVDQMISERMERQRVSLAPGGPDIWMLLGEGALRRQVGGPEVWRAQLAHLLDAVEGSRKWAVQVLPFDAGAHALSDGTIILLAFEDAAEVAFIDGPGSGRVVGQSEEVRGFRFRFDHDRAKALSPDRSLEFINNLIQGNQ
jgi:DNA-binding XRE family transcriptional regulator